MKKVKSEERKEAEAEDPMGLVGVALGEICEAEWIEMADCFIEEFARLGWTREQVLRMFRTPSYAAAHRIWRVKGEPFVAERIALAADFFNSPKGESHA